LAAGLIRSEQRVLTAQQKRISIDMKIFNRIAWVIILSLFAVFSYYVGIIIAGAVAHIPSEASIFVLFIAAILFAAFMLFSLDPFAGEFFVINQTQFAVVVCCFTYLLLLLAIRIVSKL